MTVRALAVLIVLFVNALDDADAQDPPARALAADITIHLLSDEIRGGAIRLDYHAERDLLYIMHRNGDIATFDRDARAYQVLVHGAAVGISEPSGFGVSPDGRFFVVGNDRDGAWVTGTLKRAPLIEGSDTPGQWTTVAQTLPYPLAKDFNHLMSALLVGPDARSVYINSGSRTDHGEVQDNEGAHPGLREVPITSAILRVPADGQGLVLHNDFDSLLAGGFLFADGVRNHFDMAVGPGGHLFGVENSGDRDDAEELNWLQEGKHYGFPWRMGPNDTPQQFPDYDPSEDLLINPNSAAAQLGLFVNDPDYPSPPDSLEFTDPIWNLGPHAAEYRGPDGFIYNAPIFDGAVASFTPHKTPVGLVFDTAAVLAEPYTGGGFVLGWNQATDDLLGPFDDPGEDLLHLDLEFDSTAELPYRLRTYRIADSFIMPIDAVLIDTSLYVMEMRFGGLARLWRIDFSRKKEDPRSGVAVEQVPEQPGFALIGAYPNPFNDRLSLLVAVDRPRMVRIEVVDVSGRAVRERSEWIPSAGERVVDLDSESLTAGVYIIRATIGPSVSNRVVTLVR